VPLAFGGLKIRSFTSPKILLHLFEEEILLFRWDKFSYSQAEVQSTIFTSQFSHFFVLKILEKKAKNQKSLKY
jgi:hypothetical protein